MIEDGNKKRILVVDDQEQNVMFLKLKLERVGYAVLEAYNGFEVLEIVSKEYPDLILLDIMMPEINGFDVCKKLSRDARTKHIPVILVTAVPREEYVKRSYEVGAFDYVSKPFNFDELLHRIASALRFAEDELLIKQLRSTLTQFEALHKNTNSIKKSFAEIEKRINALLETNSNFTPEQKEILQLLEKEIEKLRKHFSQISLKSIENLLLRLKEGNETIN